MRVAVEEATNGKQTPWENSSLRGDFYFVPEAEDPPPPEPAPETVIDPPTTELTRQHLAARAYEASERVNTISSYRLFVEQYPGTLYAKLAEEHIKKLESVVTPPAPSPEEVEASLGLTPAERERDTSLVCGRWDSILARPTASSALVREKQFATGRHRSAKRRRIISTRN